MRSRLIVACFLAFVTFTSEALLACGDKFFMVGRGERFSRAYATLRSGTIVIYADSPASGGKRLEDAKLYEQISRAGHRLIAVVGEEDLQRTFQTVRIDIVLTIDRPSPALASQIAAGRSKPMLLPVDTGTKIKRLLNMIEDKMKAREDAGLWRRGA